MATPLVSVLMPAYNAERFIDDAIESIVSQSAGDFELIIVDDGSNDSTVRRIMGHRDERIRWYERPHAGHAVQRNFAFRQAKGEFIAMMDADDLSAANRLSVQAAFLMRNPDIDIVGSNCIHIDDNGRPVKSVVVPQHHRDIEFMMPVLCSVIHSAAMIRREAFEKIGGYAEETIPTLDQELFLRMLKAGCRFHNIQAPLYLYRQWAGSVTRNTTELGKRISFRNGYDYIVETEHPSDRAEAYRHSLRLGLLEYYKGSMRQARRRFYACIRIAPLKTGNIVRFLIPSLMGDRMMDFMRTRGWAARLNRAITKVSGWDPQQIKSDDAR